MKKLIKTSLLIIIFLFLLLTGCGGPKTVDKHMLGEDYKETIILNKNQKLIDLDWRVISLNARVETSLWILTTDMEEDYVPKTYYYECDYKQIKIIETK